MTRKRTGVANTGNTKVKFDLQDYLEGMSKEHKDAVGEVVKTVNTIDSKLDTVIGTQLAQDNRLRQLEQIRNRGLWILGIIITSLVTWAISWLPSHSVTVSK
jgi:hypothetical protein